MADVRVRTDSQNDLKVRVGQQNAVKIVTSVSGSAGGKAVEAENVIGGIASVTSLYVSENSYFVGVTTFLGDINFDGNITGTIDGGTY
jgi:hypothetical protein